MLEEESVFFYLLQKKIFLYALKTNRGEKFNLSPHFVTLSLWLFKMFEKEFNIVFIFINKYVLIF